MAQATLIKELKKKGYIFVCRGRGNHTLTMNEYQARKMASEIRGYPGYFARAIKTSEVTAIGNEPKWVVMYKIPKRK